MKSIIEIILPILIGINLNVLVRNLILALKDDNAAAKDNHSFMLSYLVIAIFIPLLVFIKKI